MFRVLLVFLAIVWTVTAAAIKNEDDSDEEDEIYYNLKEQDAKGNYEFRFLTKKGLWRVENGTVANAGKSNEHIVVNGVYSYTDSDGEEVKIQYVADENGFRVVPQVPLTTPPPGTIYFTYQPSVIASLLGG